VVSAKPTFTWSNVDLAQSYRIRVTDENGSAVIDQTVESNSYTPSVPLERGKIYAWRVGVRFSESDSWSNSDAARIQVLSNEGYNTIDKVRRQAPGSHLALGAAYEYYGLSSEAASEYRAVKKQNPGSSLASKLLTE
jgi:hypothetical protein